MHSFWDTWLVAIAFSASHAFALDIDISSADSVSSAAKSIASGVIEVYNNGSEIPGLFGEPYYWWESGLAWNSLIKYWALTGDDTYNDLVGEGMVWQMGSQSDFMPPNQTKSEGNDDQSTWALAVMTAAENGFPLPPGADQSVSWLDLAQNVFDSQVQRWDNDTCGGGLRWQIFTFNNGYNYKNALSTGNFIQLASRLYKFTSNETYSDWVVSALDWSLAVGLVSNGSEIAGKVFDGADTETNCSQINRIQWTASAGTYLGGSAYYFNATPTPYANSFVFTFAVRINDTFAGDDHVITEVACAPNNNCNPDQVAYRAILARALADARDLSRDTTLYQSTGTLGTSNFTQGPAVGTFHGMINDILQASAKSQVAAWSSSSGLGEQLTALEFVLSNLPSKVSNASGAATSGANATATNSPGSGITNGSSSNATASATSASEGAARMTSTLTLIGALGVAMLVLL